MSDTASDELIDMEKRLRRRASNPLVVSDHALLSEAADLIARLSSDKARMEPLACVKCNSPRSVDPCPKCGTQLIKPVDGWTWPTLPDVDRIRALAKEVGYAVGVHGSLERDLDLIAAPWIAEAVTPMELAQHIATGLGGRVVDFERQDKPCGRWSCNIHTPDWTKMIDLSVMPPASPPSMEELREALKPFAELGRMVLAEAPEGAETVGLFASATGERVKVRLDDFRRAAALQNVSTTP